MLKLYCNQALPNGYYKIKSKNWKEMKYEIFIHIIHIMN